MASWCAHDDEKKDHGGRQADGDDQRDADRLPIGIGEPAAWPLLECPPAARARDRLTAHLLAAGGAERERRPAGEPSHQSNGLLTGKCGNVDAPIVGRARSVRVRPNLGPGLRSKLRRERMAAPPATGVVRCIFGTHLNRCIAFWTVNLEHDNTLRASRLLVNGRPRIG